MGVFNLDGLDFNPFKILSKYSIKICDASTLRATLTGQIDGAKLYKIVPSTTPFPNSIGSKPVRLVSRVHNPHFIGKVLSKRPTIMTYTNSLKYKVDPTAKLYDPKLRGITRRNFEYTDDDIKGMIRLGRIYTLGELEEMLKGNEVFETKQNEVCIEETEKDEKEEKNEQEGNKDEYEPEAKDNTFITSVHIKESKKSIKFNDQMMYQESTPEVSENADTDEEEEDDESTDYPATIQQSIKALRFALAHPVSYERVKNVSYAEPVKVQVDYNVILIDLHIQTKTTIHPTSIQPT